MPSKKQKTDSTEPAAATSFVAVFEAGPANGPRPRTFIAASLPERMWFAPDRRSLHRQAVTHDGWMLVGAVPGVGPPEEPWPGQIEFTFDPERSDVDLGAPERTWGTAVYVLTETE
jgi:hypothetical protein